METNEELIAYQNPIIKGFHPDPSICRVGTDYYLVTSSFEYFPGIPIFHSTDLVHWKQIGNCITRESQVSLEKVKDSGGIWAPTIRYWKGHFYVTATVEQYGNFIISASQPDGEWSDPLWLSIGGIDPSLFFEDDHVYYMTNQSLHSGKEEITLSEIDILTGEIRQEPVTVWEGIGGGFLEAPHIYHVGEWYYILTAEGGTNFNHMVTIGRSRRLWGPYEAYEHNPILTNVHDTSKQVQCAGHGDLIEDQYGNWWMVHLGIRLARRTMSHLGRETFLTPIIWKGAWPVCRNGKMAKLMEKGPLWIDTKQLDGKKIIATEWTPDFNKEQWESEWIFLRHPDFKQYIRKQGTLYMEPQGNLTFAAVRPYDFICEWTTSFQFNAMSENDKAGIMMYLASDYFYKIGKTRNEQGECFFVERQAEDMNQISIMQPIETGEICIRITTNREYVSIAYAVGNEQIVEACKLSTRFLSCELAGKCFTGMVVGVFAYSDVGTKAEFSKFVMKQM